MVSREITIKQSVVDNIVEIAAYLDSMGLAVTAKKFFREARDFLDKLTDPRRSYTYCRHPVRSLYGFKCLPFRKKYTVIFLESEREVYVTEFMLSKNLHW